MFLRIWCFLLLLSSVACAQENYLITHYGVDNGLPQSSISDIVQDKNGYLWIGTSDGLCKFDGYNFSIYRSAAKKAGTINCSWSNIFYTDSSGRLWTASHKGVSIYDPVKDGFINVFSYNPPNINSVNRVFGEDAQYVYIGLCCYGLLKVDKRTLKCSGIAIPEVNLQPAYTWFTGFMDHDKIWISHDDGTYIYNTRNKTLTTIRLPVVNFAPVNDSTLIGGTRTDIIFIDKRTLQYTHLPLTPDNRTAGITGIYPVEKNVFAVTSALLGIFYINVAERKIVKHITTLSENGQQINLYAECLYSDRSGNLWIGTAGDGLQKITYPYKKFKLYRSSKGNNDVRCIVADDKYVYTGHYGTGANIFSRDTGFIEHISARQALKTTTDNVSAMTLLSDGKLLLLTNNAYNDETNIPVIYDRHTESMTEEASLAKLLPPKIVLGNYHSFIYKAGNDEMLTNIDGYLLQLHYQSGHITGSILHNFGKEMLSCCYKGMDGILWVGAYGGLYKATGDRWTRIPALDSVYVKCLAQDRYGNIWIGTPNGLRVLSPTEHVIQVYNESNGLVNEHIYEMLDDADGNVWFSHNKGISVFMAATRQFHHYSVEDGLQSNEFNKGAYYKTADGELFFGGIKGVTSFQPRQILSNQHIPAIKITKILLHDMPMQTDSAYDNIHSLTLPYYDNSLSFGFAALEFTSPAKNVYAYRMLGIDKKWIMAGDNRFTRYPAMPPGDYTFEVIAANNDGVWAREPATIHITILPPFWKTAWFIILATLLVVGFVIATSVVITARKQRKKLLVLEMQNKIQQERERISRDLHDNVGSQLSLINNNLEWIMHPVTYISDEERKKKLNMVTDTSKEVIATLRETIWALNKEHISLEEFSDKLKGYAHKQIGVRGEITLHYHEQLDDSSVTLGPAEALHLFRICQEAVNNALKYAQATILSISVMATERKYMVMIKDNGKGFDTGLQNGNGSDDGYGLKNMAHRAAEIGCELKIISGTGTTIGISKKIVHLH